MVAATSIETSQAGAVVVSGNPASNSAKVSLLGLSAVANYPSVATRVSQAGVVALTEVDSKISVSQAGVMVVARGRTYSPSLRAWPYTLDGHDCVVIRLGEVKTLVYDLSTSQWSWYTSNDLNFWRLKIGMNWYTPGNIPSQYGSNIICGDDTFGHLWILNPEQGYDISAADQTSEIRFPRIATGQVLARQRASLPVFSVFLTGDFGDPVASGDYVTLEYSDDLGKTFTSAGNITVTPSDYSQRFNWRSLGNITQAGRLFRITDDGAFARIDALNCEIGNTNGE